MPNKRGIRLEKYGISKERRNELLGFCRQYPEWKKKIADCLTVSGVKYSNVPRSKTNAIQHPTEDAAIKISRYQKNCDLIERIAKEVDPECWQFIIKGVCGQTGVEWLRGVDNMPLCKSAYYERRALFLVLLDKERN